MSAAVFGIRHGEVENPDNVIYARLPGFGLSPRGRSQAEDLSLTLAGASVVAVFASPLQRARQTAAILARPHGLDVQTDERLLEWSFWTRWQGIPWAEVRERSPETFAAYGKDPAGLHPDDPLADVGARVLDWARESAAANAGGIVLGVSHEAPLAGAYLISRRAPLSRFGSVNIRHVEPVRLEPAPAEIVVPEALEQIV